jgi:hypothetical protein
MIPLGPSASTVTTGPVRSPNLERPAAAIRTIALPSHRLAAGDRVGDEGMADAADTGRALSPSRSRHGRRDRASALPRGCRAKV